MVQLSSSGHYQMTSTKDPKVEIIALCNQALNSQTLFQVYFVEDVLSMTNALSL